MPIQKNDCFLLPQFESREHRNRLVVRKIKNSDNIHSFDRYMQLQMSQSNSYVTTSGTKTNNSSITPTKEDIQKRKDKKKKMAAFKTFLGKIQQPDFSSPLPARRYSGQLIEQKLEVNQTCKICLQPLLEKVKECLFCHDLVCISHIRKKRRDPKTNKYTRICDSCQDTFLYKKHLKNQMKMEESLAAQESLLEIKLCQIKQVLTGKKTKLGVLKQKKQDMQSKKSKEDQRFNSQEQVIQKRAQKLKQKEYENMKMDNDLKSLSKKMPPSLQNDYQFLQQQNEKITRDLVVHQKLCKDVIKAISQREKTMYEQYYQWQYQQKQSMQKQKEKDKEDCLIY